MFHHHQHVPSQYYPQPYPLHVHTDLPPTGPPPPSSSPPSAGPPSSVVDDEYRPLYQYPVAEQYSEETYQHTEQHSVVSDASGHWQYDHQQYENHTSYEVQVPWSAQPHADQVEYQYESYQGYQQQQDVGDQVDGGVHQQYQQYQQYQEQDYHAAGRADYAPHEYHEDQHQDAHSYHNPYNQYEVQSPVEQEHIQHHVEPHMDALHPPTPQPVQADQSWSYEPPSPPPVRSDVPLDRRLPYSPPAHPSPPAAPSPPPRAPSPIPRLSQPRRSRSHSDSGQSSDATSPLPIVPSQSHVPFRPFHPYPRPVPPQAIFGLFGSYPLSRGPREHPLPGPTCAPETSSSVMRLVLTPPVKRPPPQVPSIMASLSAPPPPPVTRRPRMACYFCRKRKIACGPGPAAVRTAHGGKDCSSFEDDGPCNQCARRGLECTRPTESRRGVRKGRSKDVEEDSAEDSSPTVASGSAMTLELVSQAPRPAPVTYNRQRADADTGDPPALPPPLPPPLRPQTHS